jgi:hypothetical protein
MLMRVGQINVRAAHQPDTELLFVAVVFDVDIEFCKDDSLP